MLTSVSGTGNDYNFDIKGLMKQCSTDPQTIESGEKVRCPDGTILSSSLTPNYLDIQPVGGEDVYTVNTLTGKVVKITNPDWVTTLQADGTSEKKYNDGRIVTIDEERGITKTIDGKTVTTVNSEECTITSEITQPDDSKVQKYADKNTSSIIIPGLIPTTYYANGSVKFGNGTPSFIDKKQSITKGRETRTPYGDGNYFVEVKNKKGEVTETRIELHDSRTGSVTVEQFLVPENCAQ